MSLFSIIGEQFKALTELPAAKKRAGESERLAQDTATRSTNLFQAVGTALQSYQGSTQPAAGNIPTLPKVYEESLRSFVAKSPLTQVIAGVPVGRARVSPEREVIEHITALEAAKKTGKTGEALAREVAIQKTVERSVGFAYATAGVAPEAKAGKGLFNKLLAEARKYKSAEEFVKAIDDVRYKSVAMQGREAGYKPYTLSKQERSLLNAVEETKPSGAKTTEEVKSQLISLWNEANKGVVAAASEALKNPVQRLTSVLNKLKPLRGRQEASYATERGTRFGRAESIFSRVAGEAGFKAGRKQLGGELAKVKVSEGLRKEIRGALDQSNIDELFNHIQKNKWMTTGEKTTAGTGLGKALSGQIPTESEITILETVFGKDFAEALRLAEPWRFDLWKLAGEAGGTLKVLLSSFGDLSFAFRQGIFYATKRPIKAVKLIMTGAKSAVNPQYYELVQESIRNHEYYPLARRFNLQLTEIGGAKLTQADEQFLVRYIKNIPIFGDVVTATERAFNVMANKARADWFYKITDDLIKAGYDPIKNPEVFTKAANFVGDFTGRANLGRVLNESTELLNLFIYSPRLIVSRVKILASPITYLNAPAPLRKEAFKTLAQYIGVIGSIFGAAKLAGADVELDPRSTDFLKVKFGNTRYDVTGGLQPYIRFLAQVITGEAKVGGKIVERDRGDTVLKFLQGKASPLVSLGWDIIKGENYVGEPVTPGRAAYDHAVNLMAQDIIDMSKDTDFLTALFAAGIPAFFGVGVQTYEPRSSLGKPPGLRGGGLGKPPGL